jgi:hypothetical protein
MAKSVPEGLAEFKNLTSSGVDGPRFLKHSPSRTGCDPLNIG